MILKFPIEEFCNDGGNYDSMKTFSTRWYYTISSMTVSLLDCLVFFLTNPW
jgi:hypothetical protein